MKVCQDLTKLITISLWLSSTTRPSEGLVFVIQQFCVLNTIWTPLPSTVSNYCLQCYCTGPNVSLCKQVLVILTPTCSGLGVFSGTVLGVLNPATLINPRAPGLPGVPVAPLPGQVLPGQVVPGQVLPGQVLPGQVLPGQVLPGQVVPGQVLPGQVVPGQVLPGQVVPGQVPGAPVAPVG